MNGFFIQQSLEDIITDHQGKYFECKSLDPKKEDCAPGPYEIVKNQVFLVFLLYFWGGSAFTSSIRIQNCKKF